MSADSTKAMGDRVYQYRDAKGIECAPETAAQVYVHDLKTGATASYAIAGRYTEPRK